MFDIIERMPESQVAQTPSHSDLFSDVKPLLRPSSVAVIGAGEAANNLGGTAVRMLRKFGYPGEIWPVHPRGESVNGLPCFASVAELPGVPDLVVFAVSAARLAASVSECAAAGARHGIAWAGGFGELGGVGVELQLELAEVCHETGFSLLGPNCLGIIDTYLPLTATFASFLTEEETLIRGGISAVGQSGGLMTMAQALAQQRGFGFRYTVSTGNEVVLGVADFLHAFVEDPQTRVVAVYLEGTSQGEALVEALIEARAAGKPVIVLKGGATAASAQAAAAHTGALAGEDRVWRALLRDYAVQVASLEEMVDVACHLAGLGGNLLPTGHGAAIVTFGGGTGVLAADQCSHAGLQTPHPTSETTERLAQLVPDTASIKNPVDLTPVTFTQPQWLERFPMALDTVASDPGFDTILIQCGPMAHGGLAVASALVDFARRSPKTVSLAWPLAPAGVAEYLRDQGMYAFGEYARAIDVVAKLATYRDEQQPASAVGSSTRQIDWTGLIPDVTAGTVLTEDTCHRVLANVGLSVAAARLATDENDALFAAQAIGWPVVLKGISPSVTHRAKAGLVALSIQDEKQLRTAFGSLSRRAQELGVALEGVYVQHMETEGEELLVSAFRDPSFGVFVSCGAGGVLTELIDDVALAPAPLDAAGAARLLRRLRSIPATAELDVAAEFVASFSVVAVCAPWSRFVIELNPVKWTRSRAVAVDGLLIVEEL
jgi:acetate---CoA ligase (ADP-forming)